MTTLTGATPSSRSSQVSLARSAASAALTWSAIRSSVIVRSSPPALAMRVLRRLYPERQHDPFRAAAPLGHVARPVEMIEPASPLQQRVAHRVPRRRPPLEQRLGLTAQPVRPVVPAEDAPAQRHGLPHPGPALPRRPAPGPLLGRDAARDLEHPGPRRLDAVHVVPRPRQLDGADDAAVAVQ